MQRGAFVYKVAVWPAMADRWAVPVGSILTEKSGVDHVFSFPHRNDNVRNTEGLLRSVVSHSSSKPPVIT